MLAKENGKDDQDSGREEFALPVLKRFEPQLWIAEICKGSHRYLAMFQGFFSRGTGAMNPVHNE